MNFNSTLGPLNVALNRPYNQSSYTERKVGGGATDGNREDGSNSCTFSKPASHFWWKVQLQKKVGVFKVRNFNNFFMFFLPNIEIRDDISLDGISVQIYSDTKSLQFKTISI